MNGQKRNDAELDALLKKALPDDLPPETEKQMKARLLRFKIDIPASRGAPERTSEAPRPGFFEAGARGRLRWLFHREALAFASMLMIAAGGFFHVSGQPNELNERLSFVNTAFSISRQLQEVRAMECRLRWTSEEGRLFRGVVRWFSPGRMRADVSEGGRLRKSLWTEGSEILAADHDTNTIRKYPGLELVEDPIFRILADFMSPGNLNSAFYGEWEFRQRRTRERGGSETYVYEAEAGMAVLEMTVDGNTDLPLSVRKISAPSKDAAGPRGMILEARFIWNETTPPQGPSRDPEERRERPGWSGHSNE